MPQSSSSPTREAAERLQNALGALERALEPLVQRVHVLEQEATTHASALADNKNFDNDRARLASELDEAKAREARYKAREEDVAKLANETAEELDSVISQVLRALGEG